MKLPVKALLWVVGRMSEEGADRFGDSAGRALIIFARGAALAFFLWAAGTWFR